MAQLYYCPECDVFHDGKHRCKRHKYNATPQVVDGERFDSTREMARWRELQLRERAGEIQDLQRQVTYLLEVNGYPICKYIALRTVVELCHYACSMNSPRS